MLKKKSFLSVLSFMLALLMFLLSFPTAATTISEKAPEEVNKASKIDKALLEVMAEASPDEKIPVAIWYNDIDQAEVDTLTVEKVGFDRDSVSLDYEMPSAELLTSLKSGETGAESEMQAYLERTESKRLEERRRTDNYIMSRREISREKYNEKSAKVLTEISIPEEDILFKSQYAPMIIAELTAEEIYEVSTFEQVDIVYFEELYSGKYVSVNAELRNNSSEENGNGIETYSDTDDFYDTTEIDVIQKTINQYKVTSELTLNGNGVNIGVSETGGKVATHDEFDDANIVNVDQVKFPDDDHLVNMVRILVGSQSGFAKGANIYSTNTEYDNLETLLAQTDNNGNGIHLINMSMAFYRPGDISYLARDRWTNHIVSQHGIAVVAAASNNEAGNWAVTSPGLSHNVITVGSYHPGPDSKTFTYDKTDDRMAQSSSYNNADCVSKPDVVMPGGSTSRATAMMTGTIALMLELKPSLALYPQAVKAIVLASCNRKVLSCTGELEETMSQGITDKQGAGSPDAWNMMRIVSEGTYGVGRIKGTSTVAKRRFIVPSYGASHMNVSITWLKENYYEDGESHIDEDAVHVGEEVDLDLVVYRNNEQITPTNLTNSYAEMNYFALDSSKINYELRINKITTSYTDTVRYGYAYCTNATYIERNTDSGIYYIRNYYTDKYLTFDTSSNECTMQSFPATGTNTNQMWVLSGTEDNYELLPAYGTVGQKLNFGSQVGSNPYYKAVAGTSDLGITLNTWETDTSLEPDAYTFKSSAGGSNNILSYTSTTGIFVRSAGEPTVNMHRMWVLEDINYRMGDADLNGVLNIGDATAIQKCIAGLNSNNIKYYLSDYNLDGKVTVDDATALQKLFGGLS